MRFVGAGWAFPVRTDATGSIALVARHQEITEAVHLVLSTVPGERPMRPEFGCRIWDHVYGVADEATAGQIGHEVRAALERWEPRIDVHDVQVRFERDQPGTVHVGVRFAVRETNDVRNLVFPFYVIPDPVGPGPRERPAAAAPARRTP